ncbi:helix-turn-helix transcriptional regulator [Celeribacter sp.]|uniref:helix-turn-helix transcriptional regulator n=1 Tax=Celeribacter sp. TaxID=1890673 RepID=UPI003A8EF88D
MSKSDRLFRLLHLIRGLTPPVTAARLAGAMEVSERTIYRDIDALRAAGARIEGEAGVGYTMTEDPALPPQTFTQLEIEALVMGLSEVQSRGDAALSEAAADALIKITATLNERQQRQAAHAVNLVHRFYEPEVPQVDMTVLREATWTETALDISYSDAEGRRSERRIYPLAIVYLDHRVMILAWCCLRHDFRKFIADRIVEARRTDESFRPRRVPLLRDHIAQLKAQGKSR